MVRMIPRFYRKNKWRIVSLWILGSICMLLGSLIAGQLQRTIGTSDTGLLVAFVLSLMFFLTAGMLWVAVALALREVEEE
jgi:cation transporter-like permease